MGKPMLHFKPGRYLTEGGLTAVVLKEELSGHFVTRLRGYIEEPDGRRFDVGWYDTGRVFLGEVTDDLDLRVYLGEHESMPEEEQRSEVAPEQLIALYREAFKLLCTLVPDAEHKDDPLESARLIYRCIQHEIANYQNRIVLLRDLLTENNNKYQALQNSIAELGFVYTGAKKERTNDLNRVDDQKA